MSYPIDTPYIASEVMVSERGKVTKPGLFATSLNLIKGTAVGQIASGGLFSPYNAAHSDGTQNFVGFTVDYVNTTDGNEKIAAVAYTGEFQYSKLTGFDEHAMAQLPRAVYNAAQDLLII